MCEWLRNKAEKPSWISIRRLWPRNHWPLVGKRFNRCVINIQLSKSIWSTRVAQRDVTKPNCLFQQRIYIFVCYGDAALPNGTRWFSVDKLLGSHFVRPISHPSPGPSVNLNPSCFKRRMWFDCHKHSLIPTLHYLSQDITLVRRPRQLPPLTRPETVIGARDRRTLHSELRQRQRPRQQRDHISGQKPHLLRDYALSWNWTVQLVTSITPLLLFSHYHSWLIGRNWLRSWSPYSFMVVMGVKCRTRNSNRSNRTKMDASRYLWVVYWKNATTFFTIIEWVIFWRTK